MVNPVYLEKIAEKYEAEIKRLSLSQGLCKAPHFIHISYNTLQVICLSALSMKTAYDEGDWKRVNENRDTFPEYSNSLRYYLNLIKNNEKFRDLEMKTREGYFGSIHHGETPLYIQKLKEQDELK